MKTIRFKTLAVAAAGLALAAFGSGSFAASTWDFGSCNTTASNQAVSNSGNFGNTWNCVGSVAGNAVAVTGFGGSAAGGPAGFNTAYVSPQGSGSGFGLASQSEGLGIGPPNHAVDNAPNDATPNMILLKFNTAVALGTVTTGWAQEDSDFTVMAYTGATPTILGKNETNVASGWALVQNSAGADLGVGIQSGTDVSRTINGGNVVASWWLISAYSSAFGGSGGTLTDGNDYFKLLSVASKDVQVPEPGSLALLGVGLLGLVASRRRRQAVTA